MDPLEITGTRINPDTRIKLEVLISAGYLTRLKAVRARKKFRPENTANFLGAFIEEMIDSLFSDGLGIATRREKASVKVVRHALADFLVEGVDKATIPRLMRATGLSQPTIRLALNELEAIHFVAVGSGKNESGRLAYLYALTSEGILSASKDHPEEATRFTLGGLLPEALDPITAPAPVETTDEAGRAHSYTLGDTDPAGRPL